MIFISFDHHRSYRKDSGIRIDTHVPWIFSKQIIKSRDGILRKASYLNFIPQFYIL